MIIIVLSQNTTAASQNNKTLKAQPSLSAAPANKSVTSTTKATDTTKTTVPPSAPIATAHAPVHTMYLPPKGKITPRNVLTFGNGSEPIEEYFKILPEIDMYKAYGQYLELYEKYRESGAITPESIILEIRSQLQETLRKKTLNDDEYFLYAKSMASSWPRVAEELRRNPAKAQYFADIVIHSSSFYDAMQSITGKGHAPSYALDSAFAVTFDIAGRYGALSRDDVSYGYDATDPNAIHFRERTNHAQQEILHPDVKDVLDIGAGMGMIYRHYGITLADIRSKNIIALDRDYKINQKELDTVFRYAHGVDFADTGIKFLDTDFQTFFKSDKIKESFDFVFVLGVMSYQQNYDERLQLLNYMKTATRPGKKIAFDMSVYDGDGKDGKGGCMRFKKLIFEWSGTPPLKPSKNAEEAIDEVNSICKELGGLRIIRAITDQRNITPVGVYFDIMRTD